MPSYEFECSDGHMTEVVCRIDDREAPVPCCKCQGPTLRVYSLSVVHTLDEHIDTELTVEGSGEPFVVTSHRQKAARMRELNLECVPMSDRARDRSYKGTIYSHRRG